MSAILEFRNVDFAYSERRIFERLSFAVDRGEMMALMGPNGAGKTTLLRLAAALLNPSAGEIVLEGRAAGEWKRQQIARRVALVPQELEIPFAFRVEEIVAQGRLPHLGFFGGLARNDSDAIERAMESVGVLQLRHRIFAELSGGERQRVKIAIGLAQQPELMLLDEPTQHLDIGRQIELMALLRKLAASGITIVAAIHDLALAREHCSSGVLLIPDAPAIAGPVEELLRPESLERAFGVSRADLDRYLAAEPEVQEEIAPPRKDGHELRRRGFLRGRHNRGANHWNHE